MTKQTTTTTSYGDMPKPKRTVNCITGTPTECDNCGAIRSQHALVWPIPDVCERVLPGGTMPAGECPDCGALAYLLTDSPYPEPDTADARGKRIAEVLGLKHKYGRYSTAWGSKTPTGLYYTVAQLIKKGD